MVVFAVPDAPRYFNGCLLRVVRPHQWLVRMAASSKHVTTYTYFRVGPIGLDMVAEPPTYICVHEEFVPRHTDTAVIHGNHNHIDRRAVLPGLNDATVAIIQGSSFQYLTLPVEKGARVFAADIAPDGLTAIALAVRFIPLYAAVVLFDL